MCVQIVCGVMVLVVLLLVGCGCGVISMFGDVLNFEKWVEGECV